MAFITFPLSLPHAVNFRLARMLPMLRFRQSAGGIDRELHFSDMAVTTSAPQPFSLVPSQFGPPGFSFPLSGKRRRSAGVFPRGETKIRAGESDESLQRANDWSGRVSDGVPLKFIER